MNDHREPKYSGDILVQMRRHHDDFVTAQACRLGVGPADILAAVRDFGLTADDLSRLTDKSGLTRYSNGGSPIGLTILDMQPVKREINPGRYDPPLPKKVKAKVNVKKVKRGGPFTKSPSRWAGDGSMADAIRKVGLRK